MGEKGAARDWITRRQMCGKEKIKKSCGESALPSRKMETRNGKPNPAVLSDLQRRKEGLVVNPARPQSRHGNYKLPHRESYSACDDVKEGGQKQKRKIYKNMGTQPAA